MSERRRFNASERAALYLAADGRCASCGRELEPGWHADHVHPHSRGGDTDVTNGQALCPPCNLKKGSTPVTELREWQQEAIDRFYLHEKPDFLVSATPGAGKTTFALTLAGKLMADGTVRRVMVVVPTDALREQWADNAARFGLNLIPVREATDYEKDGYEGFVVTYQQLAMGAGADLARRATRVPTVAVLDEIHHAGDNRRWGDALRVAAGQAVHRIALTGTPWRRDKKEPIPFVQYGQDGTVVVDHPYEYGAAVADGVCRRIEFHAYDGEAKWVDHSRGRHEGVSATFTAQIGADMKDEDVSAALDAIYDPKHPWMPGVLEEAVVMLEDLRLEVPDAAGLVVAQEKWHAEAYADLLADLTGTRPPVVVSDPERDPGSIKAKAAIDRFRT
ncbi:MAG UNVERIFIED_CONTAM: DEAD/DEAH box helicase family protein, partial [Thermobifida fusca]